MNKSDRLRHIKVSGEVSTRVRDLDAMHKFYEEGVGLEGMVACSLAVLPQPRAVS